MFRAGLVAPLMLLPLKRHWYIIGVGPIAVELIDTGMPLKTKTLLGHRDRQGVPSLSASVSCPPAATAVTFVKPSGCIVWPKLLSPHITKVPSVLTAML